MTPKSVAGNVQARCPDCGGAVTTFEFQYGNSKEYGAVVVDEPQTLNRPSARWVYQLLRCAGCGRGGMAVVGVRGGRYAEVEVVEFLSSNN
jgi:hypothetical protein